MIKAFWKKKGGDRLNNLLGKNKKKVLIGLSVLVLLLLAFFVFQLLNKKSEKKAIVEKQKVEEQRQQRMSNTSWARTSFFENLPINVTLEVPAYLEGNYRMIKGDSKVDFLYIKNPDIPTPMLLVRVAKKADFKLETGEKELRSDCSEYSFAYKTYPSDSYAGADKEGFSQAIYDFNYFYSGGEYFKCFPRQ